MPTSLHRLHQWASEAPNEPAQRHRVNGQWANITSREYWDRVFWMALFLESKGFTIEDTAAILSYNIPQWVHLDLAPTLLGGKSAGLYPNASFKDIRYVIEHTDCKVLSVQNKDYYNKATDNGKVPLPASVELIIVFEGPTDFDSRAVSYDEAIKAGQELAKSKNEKDYLAAIDPKRGAHLIYTSGTTGNPKGALLSHDNLSFAIDMAKVPWELRTGGGRNTFSFLPLCHIAEKIQNIGAGITCRYRVDYCSGFDNIATDLAEVRPALMLSVPRLWEKMVEGVELKLGNATGVKKLLADWAFGVGNKRAEILYSDRPTLPASIKLQYVLANKLVLSKVKLAMGLDRVELAASGAAALPAKVAKWFRALDIEILEVFGQTESAGIICMTKPRIECAGTVGFPVEGTEFKIAEDGEILSRGRHVFVGYLKNDEATAETVIDGWLHTGDLGKINEMGQCQIIGRKKEIMKTSGGKMVAPVPIEEKIKSCPFVGQACMVGDGKKYFTMLITLAEGVNRDSAVEEAIKKTHEEVNNELANYEKIKYISILDRDFSIEEGEMTPTMKMKRAVIEKNFQNEINSMYQ